MSLLGDFLEKFYGPGHRFQSVYARVRHEKQSASGGRPHRPPIGKLKPRTTEAKTRTRDLTFWADLPDKVRVDTTRTNDGHPETATEVVRGGERLKREPDGSVSVERERRKKSQGHEWVPTEFARHFDRGLLREIFCWLQFEELGDCQVAGRDCVRIRATPIEGDGIWPHWLPSEAELYEFAADLAFPALLTIKGIAGSKVIESYEVVEVKFDEMIEDNVFECEPALGKATQQAVPIIERLTPKAAALKVPFKLLLPAKESSSPEFPPEVIYHPARGKEAQHITVSQRYRDHRLWYDLQEDFDEEIEEKLEWEEVEAGGRVFRLSDPNVEGGLAVLAFEQAGTHVQIFSDLAKSDLINFALSLQVYNR